MQMDVHYYLTLLRSLLQPCPIDSMHLVHSGLNSAGVFQYTRNTVSTWFFRSWILCNGRPWSSRSPEKVHQTITAWPKKDSLASWRASFGTLLLHISFGFLSMTTCAAHLSLSCASLLSLWWWLHSTVSRSALRPTFSLFESSYATIWMILPTQKKNRPMYVAPHVCTQEERQ